LKFADLTGSSLLQIKNLLANALVIAELNQNFQAERNEPGAIVPDTEVPEAADSPAIALNHEEVETKTRPIELRSIDMAGSTKEVDPPDTESKAVRDANPNVGLHIEREDPVTNAPETHTPDAPKSVASDHGAGLLPEIEGSAAKKRFSAWANDGVRVSVKTLEALLTETPKVHTDISKPALRRERKDPVTQAQAIGTAQSGDQLLQKESLAKNLVPMGLEPNAPMRTWAKDGSSVQRRERQLEKIAEPPALGTIGVTKTTSSEVDVEEPNPVLFAAPSPGLRTEKNAPTTIEQAVHVPKFPTSPAVASEQGDHLAQRLRTSFAQPEIRQVRTPLLEQETEEVAVDRGILRRWILAAVVVFLLIVSLAAATWISTSPIFDKIASASDLRKMIAGVFSSENGPQTGALARSNAAQEFRQEKEKRQNDEMRPDGAAVRGPRLRFDAPSGRRGLSRVSTAVKGPSGLEEKNQVSEAQATDFQTRQQLGTQVGHVSLHAAANLPEKIILPAYPAVAWQKNVQGRVTLKALISKDGRPRNIRLVGPPSLLSGSVLEVVKKWRYQPRIENGMPVEVPTQITIDFVR
jgi:TonB family protein